MTSLVRLDIGKQMLEIYKRSSDTEHEFEVIGPSIFDSVEQKDSIGCPENHQHLQTKNATQIQ